MNTPTFYYFLRDLDKSNSHRAYLVIDDTTLELRCDDDYYDGSMSVDNAIKLAHAILAAFGDKVG